MSRLIVVLAIAGLLLLLAFLRRSQVAIQASSPSAVLLWKLGRWHLQRQEDGLALSAYHLAYQAQVGAKRVRSLLTPQLLADMAQAMDSSPAGYPMKIQVYEDLALVMESLSKAGEDHLLLLTDLTELLKEIGLGCNTHQDVETEIRTWQVALRLCLVTDCGRSLRHAELLLRVGVSLAKRQKQDLRKVLDAYEEAEEIFEDLQQTSHPLYAILVHNFGATAGQLGDRKGEKESFEKALMIYRNSSKNYTETYTSLLYEVAIAREEVGDRDGGLEAFQEAERAFLLNPNISERLRLQHVVAIAEQRRAAGDLPGALHAFEIAREAHVRGGSWKSAQGRQVLKGLEEIKSVMKQLPGKKLEYFERELELHRRPGEPETAEELQAGKHLQTAGR